MKKNKDVHIVKVGPHQQDTVMYTDGICRCICVGKKCNTNNFLKILTGNRIRKMTTKEIGRLMDVDDQDIEKMENAGISPGKVRELFGNSIVVGVLTEIFREMLCENRTHENISLF